MRLPALTLQHGMARYLTKTVAFDKIDGCADSACLCPGHRSISNPSQFQVEVRARKADDCPGPQLESGKHAQFAICAQVEEACSLQDSCVLLPQSEVRSPRQWSLDTDGQFCDRLKVNQEGRLWPRRRVALLIADSAKSRELVWLAQQLHHDSARVF